jgi:hypothetical protein
MGLYLHNDPRANQLTRLGFTPPKRATDAPHQEKVLVHASLKKGRLVQLS